MSKKLDITLKTALALVEQFQSTLSLSSQADDASTNVDTSNTDPLPLLSTASLALKSHVTKLSLLTITSPFTSSAVTTTLSALNESVLPSLVTAALLINPTEHTRAFRSEVRVLTNTALKELLSLLKEVETVAYEKKERALSQSEKDIVTVAAGRVWDACDVLIDVASKGVVGFVIRRAEEYRDLVRDAVEEIEEWDPDEEEDDFFDELLGDDEPKGEGFNDDEDEDEDGEESSAALHAQKKSAIRILKPIAQIYPAIIANRLKKTPVLPATVDKIESVLANLRIIPQHVDEIAGALYEADLEKSTQYLNKAKASASTAVNLVALPWNADEQERTGDKFTTWSSTWLKVMEEVSKSINDAK